MKRRGNPHLYRAGGMRSHLPEFERRYGAEHGKAVYGAVVGKVKRERQCARCKAMHGGSGKYCDVCQLVG